MPRVAPGPRGSPAESLQAAVLRILRTGLADGADRRPRCGRPAAAGSAQTAYGGNQVGASGELMNSDGARAVPRSVSVEGGTNGDVSQTGGSVYSAESRSAGCA